MLEHRKQENRACSNRKMDKKQVMFVYLEVFYIKKTFNLLKINKQEKIARLNRKMDKNYSFKKKKNGQETEYVHMS
jgi:hypothetical protein